MIFIGVEGQCCVFTQPRPKAATLALAVKCERFMETNNGRLQAAIEIATESAVTELFKSTKERFYYCCLITTGEANCPYLSAWSVEALSSTAKTASEAAEIKWSYADSPYCFFGESYFEQVRKLFLLRSSIESSETEYENRLGVMESALKALDSKGLFGKDHHRNKLYINVEVVPPDYTNTERAIRLNPPEAISEWLQEAAE